MYSLEPEWHPLFGVKTKQYVRRDSLNLSQSDSRHQLPQSGVLRILVSRSTVGTLVREIVIATGNGPYAPQDAILERR